MGQELLSLVARLGDALHAGGPVPNGARYEVFVRSGGASGALADAEFPSPAPLARALRLLGTDYQRRVLHAVLVGVPTRRRALKYSIDGALSLFQAIDLSLDDLAPIAESFGCGAGSGCVQDVLREAELQICGWAVAMPEGLTGAPRLRYYAMMMAARGPQVLLDMACMLKFSAATRGEIEAYWARLTSHQDVVVNIDAAVSPSLKLEFPAVDLSTALSVPAPDPWRRIVATTAAACGTDRLTHLGIRWSRQNPPELCAYLPARAPGTARPPTAVKQATPTGAVA